MPSTLSVEFDVLHRVDDPCLGSANGRPARVPDALHRVQQPLGLLDGAELEVNHHEMRIGDRPMNPKAQNPRCPPVGRVVVEFGLPTLVTRNGMLNTQDRHHCLLAESGPTRSVPVTVSDYSATKRASHPYG